MNCENSIVNYFNFKNIDNLGFLKYGYFKRIIAYIIDCYNEYTLRKIFLALIHKGYFVKQKKIKTSYLYKFNPNPDIKEEPKIKKIDPNRFIIDWS